METENKPAQPEQDSVLPALTQAFDAAKAARITPPELTLLQAIELESARGIVSKAVFQLFDLAKEVEGAVVRDRRFPGEESRMLKRDGHAFGIYPLSIGQTLLRRALELDSPEEAIQWFLRVLNKKSATGATIRALWGALVDTSVQLAPDIKLVPIQDIPESHQKGWVTSAAWGFDRAPNTPMYEAPESALLLQKTIDPVIYNPSVDKLDEMASFAAEQERLNDATLALTVLGPRVVIPAAEWFTYDDPDLEQTGIRSNSRRGQIMEIQSTMPRHAPTLDPALAQEVVQAFLGMTGDSKETVRIAMQRLSHAIRRRAYGDKAVEVATALESLLGSNENTEMGFRIRVRASRLLGGTSAARARTAEIVKETYNIRSKALHEGKHNNKKRSKEIAGATMTWSEIVDASIGICAQLIGIVLRRGSIPDWDFFDINEQSAA